MYDCSARKSKLKNCLHLSGRLNLYEYLGTIQNRRRQLFCQCDNAFFNICQQLPRSDVDWTISEKIQTEKGGDGVYFSKSSQRNFQIFHFTLRNSKETITPWKF